MMKSLARWLNLMPVLAIVIGTIFSGVMAQEGSGAQSFFATNTPIAELTQPTLVTTATPEASNNQATSIPVMIFEPEECRYVPGEMTSDACRAIIEANLEPVVTPINVDGFTMSQYSFWRVGPEPVTTYDAPGGGANGQIPQGFNFVNVVNQVEGWIQSEDGYWINTNDAYFVQPSFFTGVLLPEGWNQPFGWILDTTGIYASTYPGGPADSASGLVPLHYQRFNIFAEEVDAEGWTWYMVGPDQWVKQVYMTVIKPTPRPEGVSGRWVAVDLFEQSLVAYEDDRPVFATLISTGLPGTETNEGLFTVWARLPRDTMSGATGAPNAYALQSVPWVQYFDGSISLHGTYWHDLFGYRRSRGCVNLSISDARWVFEFLTDGQSDPNGELITSHVLVHSSGEYR
jgi:hypothetical protein